MHWLRRVLRPRSEPAMPPLPRLDTPVCIVGDIHGRADLLQRLLARIAAEPALPLQRLIFAGDYIDRGPDSAKVLIMLQQLTAHGQAICLMGNHERMLLDVLDRPEMAGKRWLLNGGDATLASLGTVGRLPGEQSPRHLVLPRRPQRSDAVARGDSQPPGQGWAARLAQR